MVCNRSVLPLIRERKTIEYFIINSVVQIGCALNNLMKGNGDDHTKDDDDDDVGVFFIMSVIVMIFAFISLYVDGWSDSHHSKRNPIQIH